MPDMKAFETEALLERAQQDCAPVFARFAQTEQTVFARVLLQMQQAQVGSRQRGLLCRHDGLWL